MKWRQTARSGDLLTQISLTWGILLMAGKERCQVKEAESPHTILHRCNNHVSNGSERFRVVDVQGRWSAHVSAAINPHQHWQAFHVVLMMIVGAVVMITVAMLAIAVLMNALMSKSCFRRCPDIQIKAVFRDIGVWVPHLLASEAGEVLVPAKRHLQHMSRHVAHEIVLSRARPDEPARSRWTERALVMLNLITPPSLH